jgi:hypothetical protein
MTMAAPRKPAGERPGRKNMKTINFIFEKHIHVFQKQDIGPCAA